MARVYGTATSVRGRMGATGTVTSQYTVTDVWHDIQVVIDTAANTSTFYLDGTLMGGGVLPHSATNCGDVLGTVKIENIRTVAGDFMYIDELYTPEPATLGLLALGALFIGRRRTHI
jgi:hypothetical protein